MKRLPALASVANSFQSITKYTTVHIWPLLLFQDFAEQYVQCNPSDEKGVVDTILILAFAIVMLNTDLHSPNVKRRMTEIDFMNNLKGTDQ